MRRTLTPLVRQLLLFTVAVASFACSSESQKAQDGGAGSGGAAGQGTGGANAGTGGFAAGGNGGAATDAGIGDASAGQGNGGASAGTDAGDDASGAGGRNLTTNRDLFFGDSRCGKANVMLCEDFESGTLDAATWTPVVEKKGTAPTIDTMQAARGTHALHIIANGGEARSGILETKTFLNAANDTYYGRAFFYFKTIPSPPAQAFSHFDLVAATGTGMRGETKVFSMTDRVLKQQVFGVGTDGMGDMGVGEWSLYDNDPPGAPKPVPTGQWVCLEWMHSGDLKETHLWWDGVPHPSLDTSTTKNGTGGKPYVLPKFTQVVIGWHEWQGSTINAELWVDEIAIDKERIGCVL